MILFAGGSDVFKVARETSETSHNLEQSAVMNENTIELARHAVFLLFVFLDEKDVLKR